jgi:hypothetical protein
MYQSVSQSSYKIQSQYYYRKPIPIEILCNQSKTQIDENIQKILHKYCNLGVYGYNILRDEYWGKKYEGKKYEGKKCVLYFKLKINSLNDDNASNSSSIIIFPEIGSNEIEIKNLEIILQNFLSKKNINIMCVNCQRNELVFMQSI